LDDIATTIYDCASTARRLRGDVEQSSLVVPRRRQIAGENAGQGEAERLTPLQYQLLQIGREKGDATEVPLIGARRADVEDKVVQETDRLIGASGDVGVGAF
jgi:hypothetical protein